MSRAALVQYAFFATIGLITGVIGAAVALHPALTAAALLCVSAGAVAFAWLSTLGFAWIPLLLVASASLLPLLEVAGRPADNFVVLGTLVVALVAVIALRRRERVTLTLLAFGILTTGVVASAAYGPSGASYESAARFASYAALTAVLTRLDSAARERVITGCLATGVLLSASIYAGQLSLSDIGSYQDLESYGPRHGGLIGHPNFAAYYLGLCLIYVIARASWRAALRYPLTIVYAGALLATGSRGALIALVVAMLYSLRHWARRLLLIGCIGFVLQASFGTGAAERFDNLIASGGLTGQNSAGWRLRQWQLVSSLHDPLDLTGVGWLHSQNLISSRLGTHNGYLQVWAELGLIGCLGFAILVVSLMKVARTRGHTAVNLMVFALVANLGDPVLLYPATTYLLLALIVSMPACEPGRAACTSSPHDEATSTTSEAAPMDQQHRAKPPSNAAPVIPRQNPNWEWQVRG